MKILNTHPGSACRIAHVSFAVEKSVDRKLHQQARAAEQLGLPVDFIVLNLDSQISQQRNLFCFRLPGHQLRSIAVPKLQWPFRLYLAARACNWANYQAIVLRYPKLPLGWESFLRSVKVPVITEHHTNELAEILGTGHLLRRVLGMAACRLEQRLRKRFLPRASGIIGVTDEIVSMVKIDAPRVPAIAIPNGVLVGDVPFTGFQPFDGKTLRLVFVASRFAPWHGLDRLLQGLQRYSGNVAIELLLVGIVPDNLVRSVRQHARPPLATITASGPVYGEDLDRVLSGANMAVASLGMFRNGMQQACTLKVREYMARGIPFVYGYDDPDIPKQCEYALKLENTATPIDIACLVQFAEKTATMPGLAERMRGLAAQTMDWKGKIKKMYEFSCAVQKIPEG